jgi:NitT/TauT family transport system permease protein
MSIDRAPRRPRGGLGFLTRESYTGGSFSQIIVGRISIGIAGYLSSALVRQVGDRLMPWRRLF